MLSLVDKLKSKLLCNFIICLSEWAKPVKQTTAHAGENVEFEEHLSTDSWTATFYSHYGMNIALLWETK